MRYVAHAKFVLHLTMPTKTRVSKSKSGKKTRIAKSSKVEVAIERQLRVGVRELRQDASGILRLVKRGLVVQVTEHGKPVAELTPIRNPTLQDYINAGVISPAKRKYDPKIDKPLANPDGIDLVAELLAERAGSRY